MLIGNPDSFAIWYDAVELWSPDRFKNGCLGYFVGGKLLWSLNSTLNVDLNLLSDRDCLSYSVENITLFDLPIPGAFAELIARAFPPMDSEMEDSDYSHLVSVGSLLDDDENVFLIESGDRAKLIFGSRSDISTASAVILKRGEFQRVVRDAIEKSKVLLGL